MNQLGLSVRQRQHYRAPRKGKAISTVCHLLNRNFNPLAPNEVWAGDITYLKTPEGLNESVSLTSAVIRLCFS
ncbi:transposase OrfAB, subunit B [Xenorhabdus budapestensis]|uniref:Transposase OrfAB, subunit B n=1 Tax=Xenorhabdus budapestensis TaxID=290110 RepID=A0A2D0IP42_XENBU|nr:transposase OrfAB, subunit B [Xenorhabdus budapestensis]